MTEDRRFDIRVWLAFAAVFVAACAALLVTFSLQAREDATAARQDLTVQLDWLRRVSHLTLHRKDYESLREMLDDWAQRNPVVTRLRATTRNGFEIAAFERPATGGNLSGETATPFGFDNEVRIALTLDISDRQEATLQFRNRILAFYLLLSALTAYTLHLWLQHRRESARLREQTASLDAASAQLRIAATAFQSREGMMVTDTKKTILRVNQAFTQITGYAPEEVMGRQPSLLSSGRHDAGFYAALWDAVVDQGMWQGEIWNRRKNGEIYPQWLTITAVKDDGGATTHYVGLLTDITARKSAEEEIRALAFYDPLTQLPNRRLLVDRLRQSLAAGARSERHGALLFIDLDNFKALNDTLGHDIGDLLLQQVAERLVACVREGDTVARLGGDEFVVMLEGLSANPREAAAQVETVGDKILEALNRPYQLASYEHHCTPSIGATVFVADHTASADELMKRADLAMYQAKAAGRNTMRFFDPEMQATVLARAELEAGLRAAVRKEQFFLHYQIQVDDAGRAIGAEALVRWQHPQRGMVPPDEFIPLAEDTGLILPLGYWILETALRQIADWSRQPDMGHLSVAVNISARQFRHRDFVSLVESLLDHTGADPRRIKLELTESLLLEDVTDTIAKMSELKQYGIRFSLDDFGTGYSSLAYLKRLPLDELKIDRSFVRGIPDDADDAAIAGMTVALAENMGLCVVAEGVETAAQRDFLASINCRAYQGYLYGRPLSLPEFEAACEQRARAKS